MALTPAQERHRPLGAELLATLEQILGLEGLVSGADAVEQRTRSCLPFDTLASAVAYPATVEQVQAVVRAAGSTNVPIWPVSTGKNFGYGENSTPYDAGITMTLQRMNRIVHVDEQLGYAVLEPGVTYKQLNDHLKQTGSRLWADAAGTTQYASVLGNALDKGRGLTPMADHFGCLCGMDVVLPDGSVLETGRGSVGNNQVRHTYKWGMGPCLDGMFAQSNLGIVVNAGIWLIAGAREVRLHGVRVHCLVGQAGGFYRRVAGPDDVACDPFAPAPGQRLRDDVHRRAVPARVAGRAPPPVRRSHGAVAQGVRRDALDLRLWLVGQCRGSALPEAHDPQGAGTLRPGAVHRRGRARRLVRAAGALRGAHSQSAVGQIAGVH